MYSTLSPCIECAKLISQVGITRVVYRDLYKYTEGIDLLKKLGVIVNDIPTNTHLADPTWLKKTGLL